MGRWFESVLDLRAGAETLRRRRFGVIEMERGRLAAVHLRPWPRLALLWDAAWLGPRTHARRPGDRCWLYYNQPWGFPQFLAVTFIVSARDTSLATFRGATRVLDEIARLKRSDAAVCEIRNDRISDRLLARWGWERHLADSPRRHHIKRYYGDYPPPEEAWALCGAAAEAALLEA